jgi:OFA family oxalate/formate antiporter-like MFS transporter
MKAKWIHAAIPALLIHVSIGSVYCWSVFKQTIAQDFSVPPQQVEWGFSLAIFFLGMSAAFLGPFVEKDIKRSSILAVVCFVSGLALTGLSIAMHFLPGIYLFYGILMGIGLGVGYLTPIKNLMLWFSDQKGLATGIAVAGFGLAKVIATPVMEFLISQFGLVAMFFILATVYGLMMITAFILIKRPEGYVYNANKGKVNRLSIIKQKSFLPIWLMFYLNITCGLALISQEKDILKNLLTADGKSAVVILQIVAVVMMADAAFNTGGRLFFSSFSDKLKKRESSYQTLFMMSIAACLIYFAGQFIAPGALWPVLILLFLVNAGYGGGFSTLPVLLDQHFGISTLSTVHGLVLSAWGIAGLSGNQLSAFIVNTLKLDYSAVVVVILCLYVVSLTAITFVKKMKPSEVGN